MMCTQSPTPEGCHQDRVCSAAALQEAAPRFRTKLQNLLSLPGALLQEFQTRAKARGIHDIEFLLCQPGFVASPLHDKSVGGTPCALAGLHASSAAVSIIVPVFRTCRMSTDCLWVQEPRGQ
jgi:hypothetical protein